VTVLPEDVFIVSYPKSGNTWTRFLIGNIYHQDGLVDFTNIEKMVPDIYQNSDSDLLKIARPRILKSHESFDPRYKKVIYIVRDPRDVFISYYHHHIKFKAIGEEASLQAFLLPFLAGELDSFGSWSENVGGWLGAREGDANFMLLRYEDMLADPIRELTRVAEFLSIKVDESRLKYAVRASSADEMRKMEKGQSLYWKATKNTRQDKPFVRAAKSGGWQTELSAEIADELSFAWGAKMKALGYL